MEHPAVAAYLEQTAQLDWISDVWLSGSLASGDHHPASDIDLVALTTRALTAEDLHVLTRLHHHIDRGPGRAAALGCAYVSERLLGDARAEHPTWTHGQLVDRHLSPIARAELVTFGRALAGREPDRLLPHVRAEEVRDAAYAELTGYWSWAVRRPWIFLGPKAADLALVSMARIRAAVATGTLLTKSEAMASVRAPRDVVAGMRHRRTRGTAARMWPSVPRLAHHAWRDTRRTIAEQREPHA